MNDMTAIPIRRTSNDVDEYLRSADEAHRKQVARISEIEEQYIRQRAEIAAGYGRRVADISAEGAERLRSFDRVHQRALAEERQKLGAIARLRDG